jgi:hypothetical protein
MESELVQFVTDGKSGLGSISVSARSAGAIAVIWWSRRAHIGHWRPLYKLL